MSIQPIRFPTTSAEKLCHKFRFVKQATADPVQIPVIGAGIATNNITASHTLKVLFFLIELSSSSTLCFLNLFSSFVTKLEKLFVFFSFEKIGFKQIKITKDIRLLPTKLATKDTKGDRAEFPHSSVAMPKGRAIRASQIGIIDINITAKKLPPILLKIFCIFSIIFVVYDEKIVLIQKK